MSSWSPDSPAPQDLATGIIGPFVTGHFVNGLLFGVLVSVFLEYARSELYKRDPIITKVVMWSTLVLCAGSTAICFEETFHIAVSQKRDLGTLLAGTYAGAVQPLMTGLTGFIVQGFLIHRAGKLFTKQLYRIAFIVFMGAVALLSLVGSVLVTIRVAAFVHNTPSKLKIDIVVGIWLWAGAAVDIFISVALFLNLRSRVAGFSDSTDFILWRLIKVGLRTAAATSIPSLIGATLAFSHLSRNLRTMDAPVAFWLPLTSLYGLSIFTTLASRNELRNRDPSTIISNGPMSSNRIRAVDIRPSITLKQTQPGKQLFDSAENAVEEEEV